MDRIVYLSSLSSSTSTSSSSSSFENRLHEPIFLNPKIDYEIGLTNVICPDTYYSLYPREKESGIDLLAYVRQSKTSSTSISFPLGRVTPSVPLCAANFQDVLHTLNVDITQHLKRVLGGGGDEYKKYFMQKENARFKYFTWRGGNVTLRSAQDSVVDHEEYAHLITDIFFQFGTRIGEILGFVPDTWYNVYHKEANGEGTYQTKNIPAPYLPRMDGGVSCIIAYCDRIAPSLFGNQQVPILDMWKPGRYHEKKRINYVDMNTHQQIESIALTLRDQLGREIRFNSDCFFSLHIRPKTKNIK